jgi:hypothetical protein
MRNQYPMQPYHSQIDQTVQPQPPNDDRKILRFLETIGLIAIFWFGIYCGSILF